MEMLLLLSHHNYKSCDVNDTNIGNMTDKTSRNGIWLDGRHRTPNIYSHFVCIRIVSKQSHWGHENRVRCSIWSMNDECLFILWRIRKSSGTNKKYELLFFTKRKSREYRNEEKKTAECKFEFSTFTSTDTEEQTEPKRILLIQ